MVLDAPHVDAPFMARLKAAEAAIAGCAWATVAEQTLCTGVAHIEAELNKIKDNVEVSAEHLSEKFSSIESNAQDLNSRMSQIKSNLSKYIFKEPFQLDKSLNFYISK